jgi:nucleoid DNA-binding protein
VQLVGFGSFSVNERGAARQGRHPPDRQTDGLARQKGRPLQTRHSIGECSR